MNQVKDRLHMPYKILLSAFGGILADWMLVRVLLLVEPEECVREVSYNYFLPYFD
jgi:hypothetical protein